ncbi:hypothetical protein CRM22_008622 [Opisthorchis felineus]|uniref:Uncharacterized protein n=1 Tax=Opisthorchis felineus TaxID=147828 RepID=A0A4S2LHF4_OPIFE|nr:hypothetical protein CRM22_008622 [Opisthorchis felineus]
MEQERNTFNSTLRPPSPNYSKMFDYGSWDPMWKPLEVGEKPKNTAAKETHVSPTDLDRTSQLVHQQTTKNCSMTSRKRKNQWRKWRKSTSRCSVASTPISEKQSRLSKKTKSNGIGKHKSSGSGANQGLAKAKRPWKCAKEKDTTGRIAQNGGICMTEKRLWLLMILQAVGQFLSACTCLTGTP